MADEWEIYPKHVSYYERAAFQYSSCGVDGALRWCAPELMEGRDSQFCEPMDVYAFAICCIEILTNGTPPWKWLDDEAVRSLVLSAFAFT